MRRAAAALAAVLAVSFTGPAVGESAMDQIQDAEQPGSQIQLNFGGGGGLQVRRANGGPVFGGIGRSLFGAGSGASDGSVDLPPDPDFPVAGDPVDNALPAEGPEDLSGPGDEDPLPE
jgi:hypothetical protein